MKIIYILGLFGIFVVFIANKYGIYYPTSYKAFIPKQWDNEYKEYERLCKENIGKVVYARPLAKEKKEELINATWYGRYSPYKLYVTSINKNIYEVLYTLGTIEHGHKDFNKTIIYQQIVGYRFDRHWNEFIFFTKGSAINKKFIV
ncbi:hypothetical protein DCO58_01500 [Helicobacter saguini]|uniref:hypothetical protein n=1 Tax=Helicobacter saguini TaxID=1548018 RepID=UPI000689AD57|nr:hypothetical protein [Helicobacter saguini]MWV66388.1 hypothetical protein [Helicobacter saguini]MWV71707.1 hypothetical protein [Helicobacter saguini]